MKSNIKFKKYCGIMSAVLSALMLSLFSSCGMINDDLAPCPEGLRLRFVYDWNMEKANAFHSQVDCLTVHLYGEDGKWINTFTETSDILANENYRMTLDLPAGRYRLVVYGGVECGEASFSHISLPTQFSSYNEVGLRLNPGCLSMRDKRHLHDMFYGNLDVEVQKSTDYTEATVKLIKDTNHFRIMLQQLNGEPVDGNDFEFRIEDDNTEYDHLNNAVPNGNVSYTPWAIGSASAGYTPKGSSPDASEVKVGYAELSTGRLFSGHSPRLVIHSKERGEDIVDINLKKYLLLLKSEGYSDMGDQEFLDRMSQWNMFFFLDEDKTWNKVRIVINDWVVRINDLE